jgi:putative protein-disulfide isomerase
MNYAALADVLGGMTMEHDEKPILLYFADPMCSWCWGFAPVIRQLRENHPQLPIQMFMGGLQPGNRIPMSADGKREIRQHWEHVREASGQPFNWDFFEREDFIYDTEPASRAVVTAFRLDPQRALAFLETLQQALYGDNRDVTNADTLVSLAVESGWSADAFRELLDDSETVRLTQLGFAYARHLRVSGFPTLIGQHAGTHTVLTRGYQSLQVIEAKLQQWLPQSS